MYRRRNDVVAALTHIDVIIRVNLAPEPLACESRDDFVGVHVAARTRPGLEDVHGELRVMLAFGNFHRGALNGLGDIRLQQI